MLENMLKNACGGKNTTELDVEAKSTEQVGGVHQYLTFSFNPVVSC